MNQAFNMDCMEAMRQMPDNAFDLAVVDPPYGDAGGAILIDSGSDSTGTSSEQQPPPIIRGGWKEKKADASHKRQTQGSASPGLVGRGRQNSEKNYCVGRSAGERIFR